MQRYPALYLLAIAAVTLGGCDSFPIAGPLTSDVIANNDTTSPAHVNYVLVDVTENVIHTLAKRPKVSFQGTFGTGGPPPKHTIEVGDLLSVTIWEAGTGGLFSNPIPITQAAPSARGVALPELVVTQDGAITIPFAGRLPVTGKYPEEAEAMIIDALHGKAVEPQVIVTVTHSIENTVSVSGEVTAGARVPLSVEGDRVLDVIAAAGGVRAPVNETVVRLSRNGRTVSVPLWTIVENPQENIYLQPSDDLTLVHQPQTFTAFGALGRNIQISFEQDTVSAEEAVAKAGGLLDERADPSGVFVLRFEPIDVVRELAPDRVGPNTPDVVPVVYRLNMRQAGAYFLAREFALNDKDIVYAANASINELQKFLSLVGLGLGPAADVSSVEYYATH